MSSIRRSNAATLYPSSLCDDDIEAALKKKLLAENEKEAADADAGAEYDSDDDEDDVSISIQCHVPVSMLQYSAHDLSFNCSLQNKHMSLAMKINNCYSFAIRLLWVLTTWVLLIQSMWVNQTFWIRPSCAFIFLFIFSHVNLLSVFGPMCMNKV
jgi:hypothetical protein